jgi:hypothetical protein
MCHTKLRNSRRFISGNPRPGSYPFELPSLNLFTHAIHHYYQNRLFLVPK